MNFEELVVLLSCFDFKTLLVVFGGVVIVLSFLLWLKNMRYDVGLNNKSNKNLKI